jgi:ATP-binding cassette subfamily B (MDR/TAP) protein 1
MGSSEDDPAASSTEKQAVPEEQNKSEGKDDAKPAQTASLGNYFV